MPWKEWDQMSLKQEFVSLADAGGLSFKDLCERFGISRKTGYKWLNRHRSSGPSGLQERSRMPKHSPSQTSQILEQAVVELRIKHPTWGGRKIKHRLLALGFVKVPAPSTITGILHRHGLIQEKQPVQTAFQRFERPRPNDLWQMDFKGYFKLQNNQRCDPLTILDDHSRYNLCLKAGNTQKRQHVQESLEEVFSCYGLPWQMTMDNGGPWGTHAYGEYTQLAVWLMKLGVKVSYSRPYHPQTQGKLERFHRTLKADVLQFKTFPNYASCQNQFDAFRRLYNHERPHEAISYQVPASRYQASSRKMPAKPKEPEYDSSDKVLKVRSQGSVYHKGQDYFIGRAFKGEYVALKQRIENRIDVYFGSFKIKEFLNR